MYINMEIRNKERDYTFDILKVIALFCIVLAHVKPNKIVFQLRNFDVPLMIMVSVWISIGAVNNSDFKYINYVKKRIKRLITPTWIFLTIYFAIYLVLGQHQSIKTIVSSYLLISGIGYVWIIRIYIYIAIITPILCKIYKRTNTLVWVLSNISIYLIYLLLIQIVNDFHGTLNLLLTSSILDFVGYSLVASIAILIFNLKEKNRIYVSLVFGCIFIILGYKYNFIGTQNFKYPVRLYYLSYAFFVATLLYYTLNKLNNMKYIRYNRLINFISKNSMWIYLWHILYLKIINKFFVNLEIGYILRFIILIFISILTICIQNKLLEIIFKDKY